jgi:hypothetical protein
MRTEQSVSEIQKVRSECPKEGQFRGVGDGGQTVDRSHTGVSDGWKC